MKVTGHLNRKGGMDVNLGIQSDKGEKDKGKHHITHGSFDLRTALNLFQIPRDPDTWVGD
ncbi:MAG: hypothetical protein MjAS7_1888 [Metallosphaera javensis (ex Sakai et al. 2022)]|nr:MAG: hypothetical protein MjAS7_1888 [Metallosphaera javensis (ex Sakai et al. 2022)]